MGMDVRTPIGSFFGLLGIVLTVYGAMSDNAIYQRSLGINVNLAWGIVLLVFGGVMLFFGLRGTKKMRA